MTRARVVITSMTRQMAGIIGKTARLAAKQAIEVASVRPKSGLPRANASCGERRHRE